MSNPKILCFGELLWDVLPTGKLPGGAPMNVAYHLKSFGIDVQIISRVGDDNLGHELLSFLDQNDINKELIQIDQTNPTGTVNVELNEKGSPVYTIVESVAWDFIEVEKSIKAIENSDLFVFGSLIGRTKQNRNALFTALEHSRFNVLDVNLRKPFYDKQYIGELLAHAHLVKLNDEELMLIADWFGFSSDMNKSIFQLQDKFDLEKICLTLGDKGACLLSDNAMHVVKGYEIKVKDTIGSGDAFLAAFLASYVKGHSEEQILKNAAATGALVATHKGAMNAIDESQIQKLISDNQNTYQVLT